MQIKLSLTLTAEETIKYSNTILLYVLRNSAEKNQAIVKGSGSLLFFP